MDLTLHNGIAGIWAGVSLGGALIAAPAKFTVASLTLPVALEVGRAQFHWIGMVEIALCLLLIGSLFRFKKPQWHWIILPILILVVQQLFLMPLLNERTDLITAGSAAPPNSIHAIYIVLEVIKCLSLALLAIGYFKIENHNENNQEP
ncbi:MAG: hypothetical protein R3D86_09015 [Emcibacteraceae bacterium]